MKSTLALFVVLVAGSAQAAPFPTTYNAVRCRRAADPATAVHAAIHNGEPMGLYWIQNDEVKVLSNDLTLTDSTVTGQAPTGTYRLDFAKGTFTFTKLDGTVAQDEKNLVCAPCRTDQQYCPGDEPGHGTNTKPPTTVYDGNGDVDAGSDD